MTRRRLAGGFVLTTAMSSIALVALLIRIDLQGAASFGGHEKAEYWPYLAGFVSTSIAGVVLVLRNPEHAVMLPFAAMASGVQFLVVGQLYGISGALVEPGSLPAAAHVTAASSTAFVAGTASLVVVLSLTPDGKFRSNRDLIVARIVLAVAPIWIAAQLVFPDVNGGVLASVENPFAIDALESPSIAVQVISAVTVDLGLLWAVVGLWRRYRAARGEQRKSLLWVVLAAYLSIFAAAGAGVAVLLHNEGALHLVAGTLTLAFPLAVLAAFQRFRLYDVEHIVSRTLTWAALSAVLSMTFAIVVTLAGVVLGSWTWGGNVSIALATLTSIAVARPMFGRIELRLDRHFGRGDFDAISQVRQWLDAPVRTATVEQLLRSALDGPTLQIGYPLDDGFTVVQSDGTSGTLSTEAIPVWRDGKRIAVVGSLWGVDVTLLTRLTRMLAGELENERLRAELRHQLVLLRESRQRIVETQIQERRTIERNLHDGAQQRLIAAALRLRTLTIRHEGEPVVRDIEGVIDELTAALDELRRLANGLHPGVLTNEGLAAALADLARRTPIPLSVDMPAVRIRADSEAAAWYATCEAVSNSLKHAGAKAIDVVGVRSNGHLLVSIHDNGIGGIDEQRGLQSIRDRVETVGGRVAVSSPPGHGTTVSLELPCE